MCREHEFLFFAPTQQGMHLWSWRSKEERRRSWTCLSWRVPELTFRSACMRRGEDDRQLPDAQTPALRRRSAHSWSKSRHHHRRRPTLQFAGAVRTPARIPVLSLPRAGAADLLNIRGAQPHRPATQLSCHVVAHHSSRFYIGGEANLSQTPLVFNSALRTLLVFVTISSALICGWTQQSNTGPNAKRTALSVHSTHKGYAEYESQYSRPIHYPLGPEDASAV